MNRTTRRVKFLQDFDYKPKPSVTIAYLAGSVELVHLACAQIVIPRGIAIPTNEPIPKAGIAARIANRVKKNA